MNSDLDPNGAPKNDQNQSPESSGNPHYQKWLKGRIYGLILFMSHLWTTLHANGLDRKDKTVTLELEHRENGFELMEKYPEQFREHQREEMWKRRRRLTVAAMAVPVLISFFFPQMKSAMISQLFKTGISHLNSSVHMGDNPLRTESLPGTETSKPVKKAPASVPDRKLGDKGPQVQKPQTPKLLTETHIQ